MTPATLRLLTRALGAGTLAFGAAPVVAPARFAKVFGFSPPDSPTAEAAFRSVGVRDVALGLGLLSAGNERDPGRITPWVLARLVCDAGDTAAMAIALARGERNPRFVALLGAAVGAAAYGAWLLAMLRDVPDEDGD